MTTEELNAMFETYNQDSENEVDRGIDYKEFEKMMELFTSEGL